MAAAISSGEAGRPAGASAANSSIASPSTAVPSVWVGPGLTALTRTPPGPNSAAHALVSRTSAALLAPVKRRARHAELGGHRADVDDRALASARHRRGQLGYQHERHLDVDRECGVNIVPGHGRRGGPWGRSPH